MVVLGRAMPDRRRPLVFPQFSTSLHRRNAMGAARRLSHAAAIETKPAHPVQRPAKARIRKAKTLAAARAVVYRDSFLAPPQGEYRPVTHGW
jgi:hypothetical protein